MSDFRDNFSPQERALWLELGGTLPRNIKPFIPDWAPIAGRAEILRNIKPCQSGGDPNRRYYPQLERYVAAKMARGKKRRAA